MRSNTRIVLLLILSVLTARSLVVAQQPSADAAFVSYRVNLKKQELKLYWKDDKGKPLKSLQNLAGWLSRKGQKLVFAMNAGMYKPDNTPLGLFIQEREKITSLNSSTGNGNFYLKPNGVFYTTTDDRAMICQTDSFVNNKKIRFATQSGPMLITDGQIHSAFKQGSANVNIRNGVGILPNNEVVFAMSKIAINLYDFASYFKALGCRNALYLDGYVSQVYWPGKVQLENEGSFAVMIGVTAF